MTMNNHLHPLPNKDPPENKEHGVVVRKFPGINKESFDSFLKSMFIPTEDARAA